MKILLHACCGPCATACVERLGAKHAVTLFFSNSNIAPRSEYDKRLEQARKLAGLTGVPLIEDAYEHEAWREHVKGFENEPERGRRCEKCFEFNLCRTARYAETHGFEAFTTTLTVSPHKRSPVIFSIGKRLGPFLAEDFKKQDGFERSLRLAGQYGLYRQDYCGCEFSA